jgi:hypothetical protein
MKLSLFVQENPGQGSYVLKIGSFNGHPMTTKLGFSIYAMLSRIFLFKK